MRTPPKSVWIGLIAAALVALAVGGYLARQHYWGRHHLQEARRALERRDFRRASAHLKHCLSVWPSDPAVNLLLAQTLRRQGDLAGALKQLGECERGKVWADAVALEYALLRAQQGDLAEADSLLASCFGNPESADTPLTLEAVLRGWARTIPPPNQHAELVGTAWANVVSQVRRAIELWLRACPAPADQAQGVAWRGRLHALLGEHAKAVADFRRAVELDRDCLDGRLWLAESIAQESPLEALEHFRALLSRDPENRPIRFGLASGLRGLGRLEEARSLLDQMLAEEPNDGPALVERALLDLDLGEVTGAEARLRRALELRPDVPEVHVALSRCLKAAGKPAEAKRHYERFQQLEAERERKAGTGKSGPRRPGGG